MDCDAHYFKGKDGNYYVTKISLAGIYETFKVPEDLEQTVKNVHLKGYIYDSLAYRYIRAREQMAEYEYRIYQNKNKEDCYKAAQRDILKFCEILDEAVGEHD